MSQWLHCNSCFDFWTTFPSASAYFLSRCGHLFCSKCFAEATKTRKCPICKQAEFAAIDICSSELPENIKHYLAPSEKVQHQLGICMTEWRNIPDAIRELSSRTIEILKIKEFQSMNDNRLLSHLRQEYLEISKRLEQFQNTDRTKDAKISELEFRIRDLERELEYSRKSSDCPSENRSVSYNVTSSADVFHAFGKTPSSNQHSHDHRSFVPLASPCQSSNSTKVLGALRDLVSNAHKPSNASRGSPSNLRASPINLPKEYSPRFTERPNVNTKQHVLTSTYTTPQHNFGRLPSTSYQRGSILNTPLSIRSDSISSVESPASGSIKRNPGAITVAPSGLHRDHSRSISSFTASQYYQDYRR